MLETSPENNQYTQSVNMDSTCSGHQPGNDFKDTKQHLERLSRLAVEGIVNSRDFDYKTKVGNEVFAAKAAGFHISYGSVTASLEDFMNICKKKAQAFPGFRIDIVHIFSTIDMDAGTATLHLNTRVTEQVDTVIKGCSSLEWRRIKSGRATKWVCTRHVYPI
jgi:hypothetical protein